MADQNTDNKPEEKEKIAQKTEKSQEQPEKEVAKTTEKKPTEEVRETNDKPAKETTKESKEENTEEETKEPTKEKEPVLGPKKITKDEPNWYVITTQSGHEQKVAEAIRQRVEATGLEKIITEVLVPVQKKIIVQEGKQKIKEEKIFPGYVLIKMILDQKTWEIISNTEGVAGFVKTTKYPRPLPEDEVQAIMKFMEIERPAFQASFSNGDAVKIVEGAFADFVGSVSEIDETKGKVKVLISIFGRETPVELEFNQVKKL